MCETPENLEAVMNKVRKLLAMAEDSRGNANECANAANMAAKLMKKYELSHSEILIQSLNKSDSMDIQYVEFGKRVKGYLNSLALEVSKFNTVGASLHYDMHGNAKIKFFGYKSDVQISMWMYSYLEGSINRLRKEFANNVPKGNTKLVNSYAEGVAKGIIMSLRELKDKNDLEARGNGASTSIVVAKSAAIKRHFGTDTKVKIASKNVSDHSAMNAGIRDGRNVDVARRGVSGSTYTAQLALPR